MFALDTFEINDEKINVEEIMQKIRENIKRKKKCGDLSESDKEDSYQYEDQIMDQNKNSPMWPNEIRRDLDYLSWNWDIENNSYLINSHRPAIGKLLVKGRTIIHGEVKRYVDPMINRQREFNESVSRILNSIVNKMGQVMPKEIIESVLIDMDHEFYNRSQLANALDKKIESYNDVEAPSVNKELDLNYLVFEEKFRGSRADIKQRQMSFLRYFEGCKNVLDIGCGRGEFLELLRDNGIIGYGIDIDEIMVDFCRSNGFDVEKTDAIAYLEKLEDKSLDGIIIDQVIEHLDPNYLIKLLRLCHQKLNFGYYIVIETVNPLSLVSLANFYIDMSHKRPIHPETLKFLMNYENFREVETIFVSPIPDEMKLKKTDIEGIEGDIGRLIEIHNHNTDMLNSILYGPQDYAIVGKK